MTIRELQYAIQQAIDEKGVRDNARVKIVTNHDGELEIFAEECEWQHDQKIGNYPMWKETRLGRV